MTQRPQSGRMQGRPRQEALDIWSGIERGRHIRRPQRPHGDSGQVNTRGGDSAGRTRRAGRGPRLAAGRSRSKRRRLAVRIEALFHSMDSKRL